MKHFLAPVAILSGGGGQHFFVIYDAIFIVSVPSAALVVDVRKYSEEK